MAYPIYVGRTLDGVPPPSGDLAAHFLKLYPRATKGKRAASQRSRSRRRKSSKRGK